MSTTMQPVAIPASTLLATDETLIKILDKYGVAVVPLLKSAVGKEIRHY